MARAWKGSRSTPLSFSKIKYPLNIYEMCVLLIFTIYRHRDRNWSAFGAQNSRSLFDTWPEHTRGFLATIFQVVGRCPIENTFLRFPCLFLFVPLYRWQFRKLRSNRFFFFSFTFAKLRPSIVSRGRFFPLRKRIFTKADDLLFSCPYREIDN